VAIREGTLQSLGAGNLGQDLGAVGSTDFRIA
jgi:hypothetical protein